MYIRHALKRLVAWCRKWRDSVRLHTENSSYFWRTLSVLVVFTRQTLLQQPRASSHFTKNPLFIHKSTQQQIIFRQLLLSNNTDNQYYNCAISTTVGNKLILKTGLEIKKGTEEQLLWRFSAKLVSPNSMEQIHFQKADSR